VFTRRWHEQVGEFRPLRYTHDWDYALRMASAAHLVLLPEPLMRYRVHSSNTIREDQAAMTCRRFLVSGRVQGVFYRDSTRRQAQAIGVTGWVRNLYDGRVEVLACGDSRKLETFKKWLEIGPEYAKVTNIEEIDEQPSNIPATFDVLPTA
jgi:acylphosphatase